MWYKILNYLFGWDYILWQDCLYKGVSKIRQLPNGDYYFLKYGSINCFTRIPKENKETNKVIAWLTCNKDKYLT